MGHFTWFAFAVALSFTLVIILVSGNSIKHADVVGPKNVAQQLSKTNPSVNPCSNFYQYSCGTWVKKTVRPADHARWSPFEVVAKRTEKKLQKILDNGAPEHRTQSSSRMSALQKMFRYYRACMNESAAKLTGLPTLKRLINSYLTSKKTLLQKIVALHGANIWSFFKSYVIVDYKNSSRYLVVFSQKAEQLTFGSPMVYLGNNSNTDRHKAAFLKYGETLQGKLGWQKSRNFTKMYNKLWEFERNLAFEFETKKERGDPEKAYNLFSRSKLQALFTNGSRVPVNTEKYLNVVFGKRLHAKADILVTHPVYMKKLAGILANYTKTKEGRRIIDDYLQHHFILNALPYMSDDYYKIYMIKVKVMSGAKRASLATLCARRASSAFGFALGLLYVKKHFPKSARSESSKILELVRETYIRRFPNMTWMDAKTQQRAIEKARLIKKLTGYPSWITVAAKLNKRYKKVTITHNKLDNQFNILIYLMERNKNRLLKKPDRKEWFMPPTRVNAYYNAHLNHMVFPAAILQPPFFSATNSAPLKFGAFGTLAAHEMSHAFDANGRKFDKNGNLKNWWSNSSAELYKKGAECFEKQYDKFKVSSVNGTVDGHLTLEENIADNAGISVSLRAYEDWKSKVKYSFTAKRGLNMTDTQLFFLGFAQLWCTKMTKQFTQTVLLRDSHAPNEWRVNGVLRNLPEFSSAFRCAANAPMNPKEKCVLF